MGTKNSPGAFDCYADAELDEPIFVLRSTDKSAPDAVRHWAGTYELYKQLENADGNGPGELTARQQEKVDEARECASAMELWRKERA